MLFSSFFSIFQSQGTTFSSSKVPCSLQPWGPHTCCFFFSLHLPPLPNKPLKSLLVSVQTSAPQRSLPRPPKATLHPWLSPHSQITAATLPSPPPPLPCSLHSSHIRLQEHLCLFHHWVLNINHSAWHLRMASEILASRATE